MVCGLSGGGLRCGLRWSAVFRPTDFSRKSEFYQNGQTYPHAKTRHGSLGISHFQMPKVKFQWDPSSRAPNACAVGKHCVFHRPAFLQLKTSFPSNIHHRSHDDYLEGKCSILTSYCVQCDAHTHMNMPNNWPLDWVLSHWAHFTVLRFIFLYM